MEKMFLYERGKDLDKIILKDVHFLGAMNPPGNGRNSIDPRAISQFFCFNINSPSEESIKRILSTVLEMKFGNEHQALKASATQQPQDTESELYLLSCVADMVSIILIMFLNCLREWGGAACADKAACGHVWHAKLPPSLDGRSIIRLWR